MSRRLIVTIAGAACALYAAAGAAAFAQPMPAAPPTPGEHMAPGGPMEHHMGMMRHEGREHKDPTAHLRAILQLKPGQEAALSAFVAAMKPPEHEPEGMMHMAGGAPVPKTTPERLAMMDKMMSDHMAKAHARLEAIRTFYNQLDPAQKKAFDELPPMMMGGHEGGPMRHWEMIRAKHHMPPMPPMAPPAPHS